MSKLILLLLFSLPAFGQSYTPVQIVAPVNPSGVLANPIPGVAAYIVDGVLINVSGSRTAALASNGTLYVGYFEAAGTLHAVIWLNGLSEAPTDLSSLAGSPGLLDYADSIDAAGNILAEVKGDDQTPSTPYLLLPTVNPLQAQLTHMTSEMLFYRNGVVNWEAQALAWMATAKKCQANKGVC